MYVLCNILISQSAVRVVFDVSLEGSARKVVTVRSALMVENRLPQPVSVKMENTALKLGGKESCINEVIQV